MGGSTGRGNTRPYAEFNALVDPEAIDVVLDSGVRFTMVGLNLTHQAQATPEVVERIAAIGTPAAEAVVGWLSFFADTYRELYDLSPPVHDPCALAIAVEPSIARCRRRAHRRRARRPPHPRRDRRRPARPHRPPAERPRRARPRRPAVLGPRLRRDRRALSSKRTTAWPSTSSSPGDTAARAVRRPSSQVPFVDPRSTAYQPPAGVGRISRWRRDTTGRPSPRRSASCGRGPGRARARSGSATTTASLARVRQRSTARRTRSASEGRDTSATSALELLARARHQQPVEAQLERVDAEHALGAPRPEQRGGRVAIGVRGPHPASIRPGAHRFKVR